ncbi:hypothetical protein JCM3765_007422 [Sporobolomyces pararoseus]
MSLTNPPPNSTSDHPFTVSTIQGYENHNYHQGQCGIEPGSPLFGATELVSSGGLELDPLPPLPSLPYPQAQMHLKDYNPSGSGFGELSIDSDILVEPLFPSLPLSIDDPLPRSTPSLSPEVISIDKIHLPVEVEEEKTDSLFELDFNLFEPQSYPTFPTHLPTTNTSFHSSTTHDYPHLQPLPPPTSFSHVQSRALSFDQGLQSPLGDSPLNFLYSPEFSISPQLLPTEEPWSPQGPVGGGGGREQVWSTSVSPLLLDNLGLVPPTQDGTISFNDQANSSLGEIGIKDQEGQQQGRMRAAFSPIMSQRTYENLFQELPQPPPPSLPTSLPPLPTVDYVEEDQPMTEEVAGEEEQDSTEWVLPPAPTLSSHTPPPPPPPSRSTRPNRSSTSKRPRPSLVSNTSSNRRPSSSSGSIPPTLPPSVPIQSRTYHSTSSTSLLKPIPKSLLTKHSKALSTGVITEKELEDEASRRRRLNTLNARESRRRKAEMEEMRSRENIELKGEREWLRGRIGVLERENEGLKERLEVLEGEVDEVEERRSKRVRID